MSFAAAITGLGCLCAAGENLPRVMASLYAGRRACAPPRAFTANLDTAYPVFEVDAPLDQLTDIPLRVQPTRTSRLALAAALEALKQARLDLWRLHALRV